jgi:hypothetical protein
MQNISNCLRILWKYEDMILQIDKMVSISGLSTPVGCCGRTCTSKELIFYGPHSLSSKY